MSNKPKTVHLLAYWASDLKYTYSHIEILADKVCFFQW